MAKAWGLLLVILSFVSLGYGARSNICLSTGSVVYKPLQLYPQDCPKNPANCMTEVYNYTAAVFKSLGPKTLMPNDRESLLYITQDDNDLFDVVFIMATTYKDNIIKSVVEIDGAKPGVVELVRDDPTGDQWSWNSATNRGNATWLLQPTYTDGVVLGHIEIVDNLCVRAQFTTNWKGAISTFSILSGNVTKPTRPVSQKLSSTATTASYEFCQYPQAMITKVDVSCSSAGSATATSMSGSASYEWKKDGVSLGVASGSSSTLSNLAVGTYTVTITAKGCTATRTVTIVSTVATISVGTTVVDATRTKAGKVTLSISGGNAPYTITIKNAAGTTVSSGSTSADLPAGEYDVTVSDSCTSSTVHVVVNGPGVCPAGSYVVGDACNKCVAGTFSKTINSGSCTVCAPGTFNTAAGSTSCDECPANTFTEGGSTTCSNCPANTVSDPKSATCSSCAPGTARPVGASECSPCPAGQFRCAKSDACADCPAGKFSRVGASSCEACNAGSISTTAGSNTCSQCSENSYAASGSSACTACSSGLLAPAGSSSVAACMM